MGYWKERQIELDGRGFGEVPDKFVCADCFGNQGIKKFIAANAVEFFCSYCGKEVSSSKSPIAVSLEEAVGLIVRSLKRFYANPQDEGLSWDNEDQRYMGEIIDLEDLLLWEFELELTPSDLRKEKELYNDITSAITDYEWTPRLFEGLYKSRAYQWGWERFKKQVKHNSRYLFADISYKAEPYDDPDVPFPHKMLGHILEFVIQNKMVKKLNAGTILFRARVCTKGQVGDSAAEMGTPIAKKSKYSNRMSPAGIPFFYGSLSRDVAKEEVLTAGKGKSRVNKCLKISSFELLRDIYIVNLTKIPYSCLFDEEIPEGIINSQIFLRHFVKDISQPIKKDGSENIDYVPTQIVTEYLKYKCLAPNGKRVRGILYPSSLGKGESCALFLRNRNCVDKGKIKKDSYLQLTGVRTLNM